MLLISVAIGARHSVNSDSSLLLVYDSKITKDIDQYSSFITLLKDSEYQVTYHDLNSDDKDFELYANTGKLYQNLVIFPSKTKNLAKNVSVTQLIDFMNDGGDLLAITSPEGVQDDVKLFLNQLGIFPSPLNHKVVDHFVPTTKQGSLLLNKTNILNDIVISSEVAEISYTGSSALLSNSQMLVPLLQAPRTSYTVKRSTGNPDEIYSSGSQSYLAVALQARNNARVSWIGSDAFLSNSEFKANELFLHDLVDWTFQAKNVIKSTGVLHHHAEYKDSDEIYKLKDEVVYSISLTEWDGSKWIPYIADDVQVEVRMLDPYYRLNLSRSEIVGDAQVYTTGTFQLPDQHGVFTFYTNYKRDGLSFIEEKNVVTVRHLANNEYERSWEIPNAWVYVASNFTVAVSFLIFVFIFLFKK